MNKPEIYISIDIEADGPCAGINSMLSLGAYICNPPESLSPLLTPTFSINLFPLPDMTQNSDTMEWWKSQPEAWNALHVDQIVPKLGILEFVTWCRLVSQNGLYKLIAVAWPAAFDFSFVNYYCHRFVGGNPLGFACADIRSYASGLLNMSSYYGLDEDKIKLVNVVGHKQQGLKDHHALDDAISQGNLFMMLLHAADKQNATEARG